MKTPTQIACDKMDWVQVVLNGGPPCFHLGEDGRFCGRAKRWHSHGVHRFVSLEDLVSDAFTSGERKGRIAGLREAAVVCGKWSTSKADSDVINARADRMEVKEKQK